MSQPEREQFSAWANIPSKVLFDHDLSDRAKLLYGLISCMSNAYGFAFAKNYTLQRYLGVEERSLQRTLKQLLDGGYIRIEDGGGGRGMLRKIYTVEVRPKNPVNPDGVNPDKSDGVIINSSNNNVKIIIFFLSTFAILTPIIILTYYKRHSQINAVKIMDSVTYLW